MLCHVQGTALAEGMFHQYFKSKVSYLHVTDALSIKGICSTIQVTVVQYKKKSTGEQNNASKHVTLCLSCQ